MYKRQINSSYGRYNLSSNLTAKPTKGLDLNVRLYLAETNKDRDTRNLMSHNRFEVITADPSSTSTSVSYTQLDVYKRQG